MSLLPRHALRAQLIKHYLNSKFHLFRQYLFRDFRYVGPATVIKLCKATSSDTVVVTGLGAVGLAAIMAAKIAGCKSIVGIDRVESRLKLAIELGATSVVNTSDVDINVGEEVKKLLNGGPSIAIDATGRLALIKQAYHFTGRR